MQWARRPRRDAAVVVLCERRPRRDAAVVVLCERRPRRDAAVVVLCERRPRRDAAVVVLWERRPRRDAAVAVLWERRPRRDAAVVVLWERRPRRDAAFVDLYWIHHNVGTAPPHTLKGPWRLQSAMSRHPALSSLGQAWLVVLAGVVAALQVGKLPPALPALQADLGLSLVQSGFMLSMVQLAGLLLAVFMGLLADGMGLRRSMLCGLCLLALASAAGGWATSPCVLLALRASEGLGFLLVALPAPALIRRLVPAQKLSGMLGVWGAYMPTGTALALLAGPLFIPAWGWGAWWGLFATVSLGMAAWLFLSVPADTPVASALVSTTGGITQQRVDQKAHLSETPNGPWQRLHITLSTPGPWLVALTFGMYSGQWLAVVGFLPSIYAAAGVGGAMLGVLTALAAAVNIVGNLASGRLLQRGWAPRATLWLGFGAMALGSTVAFAAFTEGLPWLRFAGVLLFSGMGGLVPGTLFSLAVRLAPGEQQVATTVGWVQQLSALGQFVGPPAVAAVAARAGGWQLTPLVTVGCCVVGAGLASFAQLALMRQSAR